MSGAVEVGRAVEVGAVDPTTFPVTGPAQGWAAAPRPGDEVGDGRFGRALTAFAWGLGLTALLTAANLPVVLLGLLLHPDPGLAWLVVVALLPLGPALAAGLYAVREHYVDPDGGVVRAFGRGYRRNWRDASALWVPGCLLGGVGTLVATSGPAAGVPTVASGVVTGFGVLVVVTALHALALRTFFRVAAVDALQAAVFYLVTRWRASLGTLVLVVGAAVVATTASDLLLTLLAGVWVWLWYRTTAPMLRDARARFLVGTAGS